MRRVLFVVILTLVSSFTLFAKQSAKEEIVFDKTIHDFGDVMCENKDYTCTFVVENKRVKPLVLLSVNTSCSCLKASYSRRPMKSGQKSEISITLQAGKMEQGVFRRVIELQTNAGIFHIVVKGNIHLS